MPARLARTSALGLAAVLTVGLVGDPASAATPQALGVAPAADPAGTLVEFATSSSPQKIAAGPDGAMWFTLPGADRIGRISTSGVVTEVLVTPGSFPDDIVTGPDGNVWFTEAGASRIGRYDPMAGALVEFPLPTADAAPLGITAGPDGNLWFVENKGGEEKVGRITPAGVVTEFPVTPGGDLDSIVTGPDGNLWYTAPGTDVLARITTGGVSTDFAQPGTSGPADLAVGPDGLFWYSAPDTFALGAADPSGAQVLLIDGLLPVTPRGVAAAPDGALWFAATDQGGPDRLIRVRTDGTMTDVPLPSDLADPRDIAVGPDGALWFTESGVNRIGRVSTGVDPVVTPPSITGSRVVGEPLTCGGDAYSMIPESIATRWTRNGTEIVGETGASYTPVATDVGQTVACTRIARLPAVLVGFTTVSAGVVVEPAAPATTPIEPTPSTPTRAQWSRERYRVQSGATLRARLVSDSPGTFRVRLTKQERTVVSRKVRATEGRTLVRVRTRVDGRPIRPGRYVLRLLESGRQIDRAVVRVTSPRTSLSRR